jgi:VWFA-related protein
MRPLAVFLLLTSVVCPVMWGSKPITVAQLEQALAATHARHDDDLAHQIQDLRLTERLSTERLVRLSKAMTGTNSLSALRALADDSAFQPPPADEIPNAATPTVAEQRRILALTVDYVHSVLPLLPNLLATRTTEHFEDMPQTLVDMAQTIRYQPLHLTGSSSASVVYRDGKEVADEDRKTSHKDMPANGGLATQGIFGPFLGLVLVDAARSQLSWQRWESTADGVQAVFQFTVPLTHSHYEVEYCCVPHEAASEAADLELYKRVVGYHGEMTVDPSSGVIRRLLVEADLGGKAPVTRSGIIVEYGPVEIGGRTYTCPVRSISEIVGQIFQTNAKYHYALANQQQPLRTLLNDAAFKDYHIFRAETRVLAGDVPPATGPAAPPAAVASSESPKEAAEPANQPATTESAATKEPSPAEPAPAVAAPTPPPEPAEMSMEDGAMPGDTPAGSSSNSAFTIRTTTRLVDVPVVAFDKKGHPITDLKAEDFVLLDNGHKQKISHFSQATTETLSTPAEIGVEPAQAEFSNRPQTQARVQRANETILLVDSRSLAFSDWTHARDEMLRYLATASPEERIGFYALRRLAFAVLVEPTTDHALLEATLKKWMPPSDNLALAQRDETRNRQSMDYVQHVTDLLSVNGSPTGNRPSDIYGTDPQLLREDSNPQAETLSALLFVARHVASLPGHKSLIWVSSDNVLANWQDQETKNDRAVKDLSPMLIRAEEALNEAHTSVYPLDASQLEAGGVSAAQSQANVQLKPTANPMVELLTLPPEQRQEAEEALAKSQRNINPGRVTAQMKQDLHAIAPEYQDLAASTGGRAMRRAGDIATELDSIVNDGRAVYQLSFTPDTPADGTYHRITVEWAGKGRGSLRYRAGYLYRKEAETIKDRLHDAIWEPGDAREIGLTALVVGQNGARKLRLTIAAADLALSEQADRWMDKLDLITVMRDDAALEARTEGVTLALRLKPASYQSSLKDGLSVDLPAPKTTESGTVRAIVIDRDSGRMGSVTIPSALFADSAAK